MNPGELNRKIDLYGKVEYLNELGETDYRYERVSSAWAKITPISGNIQPVAGNVQNTKITHKMLIRNVRSALSNDMYIMYRGQRYDIEYFFPVYKSGDYMEIQTVLGVT